MAEKTATKTRLAAALREVAAKANSGNATTYEALAARAETGEFDDFVPPDWETQHHAQAIDMFRRQVGEALRVHLPLIGQLGHLTIDDMMGVLLAACLVVENAE